MDHRRPLAAVAFAVGFLLMTLIGRHTMQDPSLRDLWAIARGTIAWTLTHTGRIVPSESRKNTGYIFASLPVAPTILLRMVSLLAHTFGASNFLDVAGSLSGCLLMLQAFERPRVAG